MVPIRSLDVARQCRRWLSTARCPIEQIACSPSGDRTLERLSTSSVRPIKSSAPATLTSAISSLAVVGIAAAVDGFLELTSYSSRAVGLAGR